MRVRLTCTWPFGLLFAALLLVASCTKDVDEPVFELQPTLTLEAQSATALTSFQDTLRLRLGYQDGDGNLGGFDVGSALFVLDSRLQAPDQFQLERFTPNGQALSISGTLDVVLGPYFLLGNGQQEDVTLELWLTDRFGNESNRVVTSPITIRE